MSDDLVKRLRARSAMITGPENFAMECPDYDCIEAAARIEELEAALREDDQ